jgi:hypothetical protein
MTFLSNQQYLSGRDIVKLTVNMCENTPADNYSAATSGMRDAIREGPKPLVSKYSSASRAQHQKKHQNIVNNKENKNAVTASSTVAISMPNSNDVNSKNALKVENKRIQNSYADDAMMSMAQYAGQAVFPLPKGGYPAYSGYPKTIVDWEIKKRESIIAIHKEMHGHAELLSQLRDRVSRAEAKHMEYMTNKHAEYDMKHSQERELMAIEKEEMMKLYSMEQEVTRQRIESLAALERISNEETKLTEQLERSREG